MDSNRPGIVYNSADGGKKHLPLEQVRVKAVVVDISAKITLTQTYSNTTDTTTSRCKYRFPVPASGAICAFSMHTSDGRTLIGLSKEKDQAREEFEAAVSAGNFAGKVEYVTDDIFTISIGCIPAQATVEIKLVYVMNLANDDNSDEIRFQLPISIGERYGTPPPELTSSLAPDAQTRVKITVQIQTSGRIQDITSPSHPNDISETRYPTDLGRPSRRRSTIKFQPCSFLDRDFVLIVHAEGLDSPRSFAELYQDPENKEHTIAMQLTIIPKFDLPPLNTQEYIFMVDRSGSMSGDRIETAKRTLNILLRMLPAKGTTFNIFSFGSHVDGLWKQSRPYNQDSLNVATNHVDAMQADYGGTEIHQAIEQVLGSRATWMPTAVFILTDGEAHQIDKTCQAVQTAVQYALAESPLRVFTLGIGNTVSSAMCEGIARAGNGVCLLAVNTESILGKCARLFRAGRTPFVKNVKIDWGIPEHYWSRPPMVNFADHASISRMSEIRSLPAMQQVPSHINDIHAGNRMCVSVILSLRKVKVPKAVTLRGELDGGGTFEVTVPIMGIQLKDAEPELPWVHTLAAWRLIQEHAEHKAPLPPALASASEDDIRKDVVVRLGEKYQLVSKHTSFVAVDAGQDDTRQSRGRALGLVSRSRSPSPSWAPEEYKPTTTNGSQGGLRSSIQSFFTGIFGFDLTGQNSSQEVPGAWPETPMPSRPASENGEDGDSEYESVATFSTLSSLEGSDNWSDWSAPPSPYLGPHIPEEEAERLRSPSPQFEPERLAPEEDRLLLPRKPLSMPPPPPQPVGPVVVNLIRFQAFDGSFVLGEVRNFVGNKAVDEVNNLNVDDKVWATALSVAFIRRQMGKRGELLDDLLVKAMEFLRGANINVEEVVRRAEAELA